MIPYHVSIGVNKKFETIFNTLHFLHTKVHIDADLSVTGL